MEALTLIFFALVATVIGAVPLGLVNLSVMDTSYRNGFPLAMQISSGAALVEIAYGITALVAGGLFAHLIRDYKLVYYIMLAVPAILGIVFLLKKSYKRAAYEIKMKGFLKGILLNLLSIQVFLYWLIAMTYLNIALDIVVNLLTIILFALGIWLGKMGVLWLYAHFSKRIFSKMGILARNIDRIIGIVLLLTVFLQLLM